jgi:hypothetical protein
MFSKPLTNEEVWEFLPLSKTQRELIIKDFIEAGLYDKIEENEWIDKTGHTAPVRPLLEEKSTAVEN